MVYTNKQLKKIAQNPRALNTFAKGNAPMTRFDAMNIKNAQTYQALDARDKEIRMNTALSKAQTHNRSIDPKAFKSTWLAKENAFIKQRNQSILNYQYDTGTIGEVADYSGQFAGMQPYGGPTLGSPKGGISYSQGFKDLLKERQGDIAAMGAENLRQRSGDSPPVRESLTAYGDPSSYTGGNAPRDAAPDVQDGSKKEGGMPTWGWIALAGGGALIAVAALRGR